ncbi:histone H1-binding protein [Coniochaeta sp. 2T2.1]|nr:histone H1-binding protein [Coniochaeta sp. 2T2.1]
MADTNDLPRAEDVDNVASTLTAVSAPGTGAVTPIPGTGASTPFFELNEGQRRLSLNVSLADITAKATALYNQKKYEESAELFSQATEMQAEMNGEMHLDNAEILFLYGRALFKVGQSKSDVLGQAPAAGQEEAKLTQKPKKTKKPAGESASTEEVIEEKVATLAEGAVEETKTDESAEKKPLFQFTGDENFDESDEEGEDDGAENEEGEADDDLAVAFGILDMARILYLKKLESLQATEDSEAGKGSDAGELKGDPSPAIKHIKKQLGETHDLLAEISLENERYTDAIEDARASLKYKQELYTDESEVIAEAHYKLCLALEFASISPAKDENGESEDKPVDQGLRDEAARELQAAIDSTKLKLQANQVDLATLHSPEDNEATREQINNVQELIAEMEQKLIELRKPPVDVQSEIKTQMFGAAANAFGGLLGAGSSSSTIEEAKKTAKDLTGLVRKKAKDEPMPAAETNGHGKRKAEESADASAEGESKKAKVEDASAEA